MSDDICGLCEHIHDSEIVDAQSCTTDDCECDGACDDCARALRYDGETDLYHHITNPERGCFLIAAEMENAR